MGHRFTKNVCTPVVTSLTLLTPFSLSLSLSLSLFYAYILGVIRNKYMWYVSPYYAVQMFVLRCLIQRDVRKPVLL